jgi:Zn-dependent protease with chaperone function
METTASNRVRLTDLPASAFQHPLDREATDHLKRIRGFDMIVTKFLEYGFERLYYVINMANSIRVGPNQLPSLYNMLTLSCDTLDVVEPELYIMQDHRPNAFTFGHTNPFIVIHTALLDVLSEDEVMAVISHELGHIKCGHVLYTEMAYLMQALAQHIAKVTLGIGGVLLAPLEAPLVIWKRRAELSADRASMLVMQDPQPCLSMLMKLSGGSKYHGGDLNLDAFVKQAHSYHEDLDTRMSDQFYRLVASVYKNSHPFTVERARALLDWLDSTEPQRILRGEFSDLNNTARERPCSTCGHRLPANGRFCIHCHQPIRPF